MTCAVPWLVAALIVSAIFSVGYVIGALVTRMDYSPWEEDV